VEVDSIDERIFVDRPRMRRPLSQSLAVRLASSLDVVLADCRERDKLDPVNLDLP
jgi:hypothetical protein